MGTLTHMRRAILPSGLSCSTVAKVNHCKAEKKRRLFFLPSLWRTSASMWVTSPTLACLLTPQSMAFHPIPLQQTNPENAPWVCFHSETSTPKTIAPDHSPPSSLPSFCFLSPLMITRSQGALLGRMALSPSAPAYAEWHPFNHLNSLNLPSS